MNVFLLAEVKFKRRLNKPSRGLLSLVEQAISETLAEKKYVRQSDLTPSCGRCITSRFSFLLNEGISRFFSPSRKAKMARA